MSPSAIIFNDVFNSACYCAGPALCIISRICLNKSDLKTGPTSVASDIPGVCSDPGADTDTGLAVSSSTRQTRGMSPARARKLSDGKKFDGSRLARMMHLRASDRSLRASDWSLRSSDGSLQASDGSLMARRMHLLTRPGCPLAISYELIGN